MTEPDAHAKSAPPMTEGVQLDRVFDALEAAAQVAEGRPAERLVTPVTEEDFRAAAKLDRLSFPVKALSLEIAGLDEPETKRPKGSPKAAPVEDFDCRDLLLAPAVIGGTIVGRWLLGRINQRLFENIAIVLTVAAGVRMFI